MSQRTRERLIEVVAAAKRHDPLAPVTVIVPSNLAGRTLGWTLAAGLGDNHRGIAGLRITTLARLAESVAVVTLHPRRPLLPTVLSAAWRSELEAASARRDWEFAGVWNHPSTVAALSRAYRDLREVPPNTLDPATLPRVPAETVRLARKVRARLQPGWYDQQDLYAAAGDLIHAEPKRFREFGALIRFLPGADSRSATAFFDELVAAFGVTTVEDPEPAFADRVLHASDSDDEVRVVVREVVAALKNGQPARRLAILHSRNDPYVRTLHAHLTASGVTFNGRGGIPVLERPCARAFIELLELPGQQYPRARLFDILASWPLRDFDTGEPVPSVTWERISREANITGGQPLAEGWLNRLSRYASQPRNSRNQQPADELRDFVQTLDRRLHELDSAQSWSEVSTLAIALLDNLFGDVADIKRWRHDDKRALVTLRTTLAGLVSLDAYRPPQGLSDLLDVLSANLETAIPRTGRFGQGVFVGPISEGRGLDLDQLWIVGLAEDLYPGRQAEDALLPDQLRADATGLLSARDRTQRLVDDLAAAFQAATTVTASFPRGDLRASTEKLPSRLLLPSLRSLVGRPSLAATEWQDAPRVATVVDCPSHAAGMRNTPLPASDQEWSQRHVLERRGPFDDPIFLAARDLRIHRLSGSFTRFDGNLTGAEGLPDFARSDAVLSPTSLEAYAACPFTYFVHRLLGAKPVEEPSGLVAIAANDLGNIFHYALDRFITAERSNDTLPGPGQPWTSDQQRRLHDTAMEVIAEHEQEGRLGHPTLWQFQQADVLAEFDQLLVDDSDWRATNGSQPLEAELSFGSGSGFDHPPVPVVVAGGTVHFQGRADKLDRASGVLFITDMKTGKRDAFGKIESSRNGYNPTVDGTKLQLPVYAAAALAAYPDARTVQSQYWFVHGEDRGKRVRLDLTPTLQDTYSAVVGALVHDIAQGHFIKKPSKQPGFAWVDCEYCTPHGVGHAAIRRGYEDKRLTSSLLALLDVIDPEGAQASRQVAEGDERVIEGGTEIGRGQP